MARFGKKPIFIPEGIEVKIEDKFIPQIKGKSNKVGGADTYRNQSHPDTPPQCFGGGFIKCKGPKGELIFKVDENLKAERKENAIVFSVVKKTSEAAKLLGTARSCLINTLYGVKEGYEKKLEIIGVGFRAQLSGKKLVLHLGFSHPLDIEAPRGIEFKVAKNIISVLGIDKQLVGITAAKIKALKPPEPYKGKGVRYLGEHIRKKLGKKAVATTAAA
jgi:large subunit ribosomal protein L6